MEYKIGHQEIEQVEAQIGGLPLLLGLLSGVISSGDINFAEIYIASLPCAGFKLLDIMRATESATEKYALGYIISRTGRYVLEHPDVFNQIGNYISNLRLLQ